MSARKYTWQHIQSETVHFWSVLIWRLFNVKVFYAMTAISCSLNQMKWYGFFSRVYWKTRMGLSHVYAAPTGFEVFSNDICIRALLTELTKQVHYPNRFISISHLYVSNLIRWQLSMSAVSQIIGVIRCRCLDFKSGSATLSRTCRYLIYK